MDDSARAGAALIAAWQDHDPTSDEIGEAVATLLQAIKAQLEQRKRYPPAEIWSPDYDRVIGRRRRAS